MPSPTYMWAKGARQGDFKGSVDIAGREDSVEIFDMKHQLHSPTDIASGAATGKRQHMPLEVICAIDKATPLFYGACATNETLPEVKFSFFRVDQTGTEGEYYTIVLTNARVVDVSLDVPNSRDTDNEQFPHMIKYAFVYQAITWTWADGGIEAQDDWKAPL